jgi:phage terminase large subunit-like protein
VERECARAKENPALENTFRRLHLNTQTEQDVRAIDMAKWDACAALPFDEGDLEGRACYAGLDLASTTDLAAFAMVFPIGDYFAALVRFWAPRERARQRSRKDRVPYELWAQQGFIRLTDGDVIDYDVIRKDVRADAERFAVREIAADRWNATQIITQLQGDGLEVVAFGQGFASMTAPTKELLKLNAARKIAHGGNPVLRWMASLMAVEIDAAENLKPSKKKSTDRIDGMVAVIMGLGRAMLAPAEAAVSVEVW